VRCSLKQLKLILCAIFKSNCFRKTGGAEELLNLLKILTYVPLKVVTDVYIFTRDDGAVDFSKNGPASGSGSTQIGKIRLWLYLL